MVLVAVGNVREGSGGSARVVWVAEGSVEAARLPSLPCALQLCCLCSLVLLCWVWWCLCLNANVCACRGAAGARGSRRAWV